MATKKDLRRLKIRRGIRSKIRGTAEIPRCSVFKSNTGIIVQLVDDIKGTTLIYASSKEISDSKSINITVSHELGKKIAEKASQVGISKVVFDRGGYMYHGKIKALAEGAREGGLKF